MTAFNNTVQFFERIGSAIGNAISSGVKGAINWIIGIINGFIHGINWVIDGLNHVPGVNIGHIPDVPRLHSGGTVGGAPGSEQLRMLQAGETVFPRDAALNGGATRVEIIFPTNTDSAVGTMFMQLVRSGDIQLVVR